MINRSINHIDIPVKKGTLLAKFYGETFGWETHTIKMKGSDYTIWQSANMRGGFPDMEGENQLKNVVVYLDSDDIPSDLDKIETNGGKTILGKTEIPDVGWYAYFSDPTGNQMGLFTRIKKD